MYQRTSFHGHSSKLINVSSYHQNMISDAAVSPSQVDIHMWFENWAILLMCIYIRWDLYMLFIRWNEHRPTRLSWRDLISHAGHRYRRSWRDGVCAAFSVHACRILASEWVWKWGGHADVLLRRLTSEFVLVLNCYLLIIAIVDFFLQQHTRTYIYNSTLLHIF